MASDASRATEPLGRLRGPTAWLRLLGTLVVVVLVVLNRDFVVSTFRSIGRAQASWLALGASLHVGSIVASALRMRLLLESFGYLRASRSLALDSARAIGLSASLAIGAGDVFRVGRLRVQGVSLIDAGLVVAVDRALGTLAVAGTGVLCLLTMDPDPVGFSWPVAIGCALLAVALVVSVWMARARVPSSWRLRLFVLANPARTVPLLASTALVLALWLGSVVSFARSVGIEVEASVLAATASWVTLATLLPISIGGVGVREAGYVVLLAAHGVPATNAVALGVIQYVAMLTISAIAWSVPGRSRRDPDTHSSEARALES